MMDERILQKIDNKFNGPVSCGSIANYAYITNKGELIFRSEGCHANFYMAASQEYVSSYFRPSDISGRDEFVETLVGLNPKQRSPYHLVLEHFKDRSHISRDSGGKIVAITFYQPWTMEYRYLLNFAKASRTVTEHSPTLGFWAKYKDRPDNSAGLLYMLSYFFDTSGGKKHTSHSPIETTRLEGVCNLKTFAYPELAPWKLKCPKERQNYDTMGENALMWGGGKFNPHENIKSADYIPVKTRFWGKYHEKTPTKISERDIRAFMENVYKGLYDEYI